MHSLSIGEATVEAMVEGLAPGYSTVIVITGKSTTGSALMGRLKYAATPKIINDTMISVVIIGFFIKISEKFISSVVVLSLVSAIHRLKPSARLLLPYPQL
jgi:hypothetical protein